MRDFAAAILAVLLILVALSLATTLRRHRQSRERARDSERALGRTIVAEVPTADELVLFSEDQPRFYYGDRPIDYTAYAMYPGQARQERLVTKLAPGRTTIKKYRFIDVNFAPDAKVRSGVKELVGTRVLNDEVAIQ